jgi:hypothetical protein
MTRMALCIEGLSRRIFRGWRGVGVPGPRGVLFFAPTTLSDGL